MTLIYNISGLKDCRRALRKSSSPAEILLWEHVRNRKLDGLKFRRQYSIGNYVVDFYCPQLRLAIEVDGETHRSAEAERYDDQRQAYLEQLGVHVVRYQNEEVQQELDGVISGILMTARNLLGSSNKE